jgi:LAO/AO transport system kinase
MSTILDLLARAQQGQRSAIARLLTIVENEEADAPEVVRATHANTGNAKLIGTHILQVSR